MEKEDLISQKKVFLSDCGPSQAFWINNGTVVRNIYELADAIEAMDDETFIYHVNDDNYKNDFALWIKVTFEDPELAHRLVNIRDKFIYARVIKDRILEYESVN